MMSVKVGQVYERLTGPPLTAKVLRVEDAWAMCRMTRPSGRSLPGERPVPVELLEGEYFALQADDPVEGE